MSLVKHITIGGENAEIIDARLPESITTANATELLQVDATGHLQLVANAPSVVGISYDTTTNNLTLGTQTGSPVIKLATLDPGSSVTPTQINTAMTALVNSEATQADLEKLHDVTASATEINALTGSGVVKADLEKLHGVTASANQLNYLNNADLTAADITKLAAIEATADDVNLLNGTQAYGLTNADLKKLADVNATAEEINTLNGSGITKADLEKLHAVTATKDDLNILAGATGNVTSADLTKLGDITATASEINILHGVTTTGTTAIAAANINTLAGINTTETIQSQLDKKINKPSSPSAGNILKYDSTSSSWIAGSIDASGIGSSAITTDKLADDAVTSAKIATGAVSADALDSSIISGTPSSTNKIATASVTGTPDSGKTLQSEIDDVEASITTLKGDASTTGSVANTATTITTAAINALDQTSTNDSALKTVDAITQTDGKVVATFKDISEMTAATSSTAGVKGLVPASAAGEQNKLLTAGKTWVAVVDDLTTASSTQPLSAAQGKALSERVASLEALGKYLALWDCTTGKPTTEPSSKPYAYSTGCYYRVSKVGTTNYKPNGTEYTGAASTTVESGTVNVGDLYLYDGSTWSLQQVKDPSAITDVKIQTGTGTATTVVSSGVATIKADGSTVEFNTDGKLQVKDASISTAKIADNAVTAAKVKDSELTVAKFASTAVSTAIPSTGAVDTKLTTEKAVDDAISNIAEFSGASSSTAGKKGFVPAPASGSQNKFLKADGSWSDIPADSLIMTATPDFTDYTFTVDKTPEEIKTARSNKKPILLYIPMGTSMANMTEVVGIDNGDGSFYVNIPTGDSVYVIEGEPNTGGTAYEGIFYERKNQRQIEVTTDTGLTLDESTAEYLNVKLEGTAFKGATSSANGKMGMVKQPVAGEEGKFLKGDGTWATVDALPAQSGQSGKYLTTNGTTASWKTVKFKITGTITGASNPYTLTVDKTPAEVLEAQAAGQDIYLAVPISGTDNVLNILSLASDGAIEATNILGNMSYKALLPVVSSAYSGCTIELQDITTKFTGATSSVAGKLGTVPAPAAGDEAKFLRGDGAWAAVDLTSKADKVASATADNFAALDANGNLKDSGKKAADFVAEPSTKTSGNFLKYDGSAWTAENISQVPAVSSTTNGQYLKSTSTGCEWATVDALPSQSGQGGKFLTTNGTTASWSDVASIDFTRASYTVPATPSATITFPSGFSITSADALAVYQNGLLLEKTTHYTVASDLSGITLTSTPTSGDIISFAAKIATGAASYIINPASKTANQYLMYNGTEWIASGISGTTASLESGTNNGTLKFTLNGTATDNIAVKGLGSAAYTASTDYATSAQGSKADSALQSSDITTGSANGNINIKGTDVAVKGLGSAAYAATTDFAAASTLDNKQDKLAVTGTASTPVYVSAAGTVSACTSSVISYPLGGSSLTTAAWNTEYRLGSVGALAFTLPTPPAACSAEVRITLTSTASITPSVTLPSGYSLLGGSDVSIASGKIYELSYAVIDGSHIAVACKEWA